MSLYDRYALANPPSVSTDGEYQIYVDLEKGDTLCEVEIRDGMIVRVEDVEEGQQIIPATLPQSEVNRIFSKIFA
jgi:hypothetical protein